ncbi:MAG: hypothetical protein IT317_01110 [Anaerolineales bacterium]|nr:hypothetical protein [Anaerolineales bacterium]
MTVNFATKYPAALTNTAWQRRKNRLDKALPKTGLGPALTQAEAAWKDIPFKALDARTAKAVTAAKAKENLAAAKQIKKNEVKLGLAAVVKALKLAQRTSANKLLSGPACTGAREIAAGLDTLQGYLLHLTIDDLSHKVDELAAAANAEQALRAIELRREGGATANAPKAVRQLDGTVTVTGLEWELTAGNPRKLLNVLITVRATQTDGSLFINDMILTALSNDLKTARFKNP